MAIVNAFILYDLCHPDKPLTQRQFRLKIAYTLVEDHINERASPSRPVLTRERRSSLDRLKGNIFPPLPLKERGVLAKTLKLTTIVQNVTSISAKVNAFKSIIHCIVSDLLLIVD